MMLLTKRMLWVSASNDKDSKAIIKRTIRHHETIGTSKKQLRKYYCIAAKTDEKKIKQVKKQITDLRNKEFKLCEKAFKKGTHI